MSGLKRWLEEVNCQMGSGGEINNRVLERAEQILQVGVQRRNGPLDTDSLYTTALLRRRRE